MKSTGNRQRAIGNLQIRNFLLFATKNPYLTLSKAVEWLMVTFGFINHNWSHNMRDRNIGPQKISEAILPLRNRGRTPQLV